MDLSSFLATLSIAAIPIVFAITLHEVAHGWVARSFGDNTAAAQGRLSFNPIRHIDPIGTVLVPIVLLWLGGFLFGWAKPVPVNPRHMRDPRRAMVMVSAAGPAANLAMAVTWAFLMMICQRGDLGVAGIWVQNMALYGIVINLILCVFNLLPIPPLDGGQLLRNLVPTGPLTRLLDAMQPYGFFIVLALVATGATQRILGPPIDFLTSLLFALFGLRTA